jgi:SAM-dependent methyltransferase
MANSSTNQSPYFDGLPENALKYQQSKYQEWWKEYGPTPAGLAWNKGKQGIRFDALLSYFEPREYSVLDVGCGFGDLNVALEFVYGNCSYHGIDIVEPYLHEGRRRFPDGAFEFGEFLAMDFKNSFDLAFASGTFNFELPDVEQYSYLEANLTKMFSLTNEGIAVDMLSDRVNFRREGCFYYSPTRVLEIALSLTRNVALRHDYLPFEFSVALYRDDSFDENTTFKRHLNRNRPLLSQKRLL